MDGKDVLNRGGEGSAAGIGLPSGRSAVLQRDVLGWLYRRDRIAEELAVVYEGRSVTVLRGDLQPTRS
jgi:hypothetical protein